MSVKQADCWAERATKPGGNKQWQVWRKILTCVHFKNPATKVVLGINDFPIERLLSDYQATFPLRCGNFILSPTLLYLQIFGKYVSPQTYKKLYDKTSFSNF